MVNGCTFKALPTTSEVKVQAIYGSPGYIWLYNTVVLLSIAQYFE